MSGTARVLLLVTLAMTGPGCQSRAGNRQADPARDGPAVTFDGVSLAQYDGATREWDLRATRARYDDRIADLDQVTLRYYRDGRAVAHCRAPGAAFDTGSRDLTLRGPVEVSGEPGDVLLEAETVRWSATDRLLRAKGRITYRRGPAHLVASGVEADLDVEKVVLAGPIAARFRLGRRR